MHKEAESAESLLWGGRFFHVILAQARTGDLVDLLFVLRDQCKAAKRPNKQPERGHDWSGCVYPKHLARLVVAKARKPLWTVVVISLPCRQLPTCQTPLPAYDLLLLSGIH